MELIGANLRRFVANRQDEEAAAAMLSGSMFAGIAFAWARLGNIHAMSHPVSAYFHVAHGVQMRFFFQRLWNIMHLQIMDVMRRSTIISAKKKTR